jgi:alkylation response protein AidB-like acyl-CoA dehydrogenase
MAGVEDMWCQGWSEPNAGSDLAGIQSKAVRDDERGGWRLSGQKTWTTRGAFCSRLFGLFRSDPEAERHRGLTYFLVDLEADGVTVRPVDKLDGDAGFAEVFLENVFVPDVDVLGEVHKGWSVAMATTGSERGLTLRSPGRFLAAADRLVDLYREAGATADPGLRDAVTRAWIGAQAYQWGTLETVTRLSDGEKMGAESSLNKVFWSELDVHLEQTAVRLLGREAETDRTGWMKAFLFALAGPIYAGTNEIQRNVIAERLLGLPRK